jgi:hypothetical protein
MLDSVSCEDLDPAIVQLHWNVDGDLAARRPQHLSQSIINAEKSRRVVESRFGGQLGVKLGIFVSRRQIRRGFGHGGSCTHNAKLTSAFIIGCREEAQVTIYVVKD